MITIRNAKLTDYEMVKQLEDALFLLHKEARPDYFHEQSEYSKEEYEELLNHPSPINLVAISNEQVVGICFGRIEQTTGNSFCRGRKIAMIEDVFTLSEYRGNGIASLMMKKAREQAMEVGVESLELCVWNFNKEAIHFYEKLGMKMQYCRMEERFV